MNKWVAYFAKKFCGGGEAVHFLSEVDRLLSRCEPYREGLFRTPDESVDASHCREMLEAYHADLCELHGYFPNTSEGNILWDAIFNPEEYDGCIELIMQIRWGTK